MDFKKIILYVALIAVVFILWNNWQQYYATIVASDADNQSSEIAQSSPALDGSGSENAYVPTIPAATTTEANSPQQPSMPELAPVTAERLIHIQTDLLDLSLDSVGGAIVGAKLLDYQQEIDATNQPYVLFDDAADSRYVAQSGVVQAGETNSQPLQFTTSSQDNRLQPGQDQLVVTLTGEDDNGLLVEKELTFHRNSYLIEVVHRLHNQSQQAWHGSVYTQLVRVEPTHVKSGFFDLTAYVGASVSDPATKLYRKLSFKEMRKNNFNQTITGGWAAMQEHYFLTAWIPDSEQTSRYYSHVSNNDEFTVGMVGPRLTVSPGEQTGVLSELYVGPEHADILKPIAPGLDLTVDYGWLWFISVFLLHVLTYIHSIVGNWGWSIVIVTALIKLAFYRLSARSYRSMANMRKLQPKVLALRERYADDKVKLSQATMALYKEEKVNPLGGCLPILVQIPVFIGLYWVLLESVELRHAPFIFWIHDLSARDPYFVLPIIMGLTMLVQQKLSPPPPDPTQAKVMMILPIVFTFLFLQFPAGLVLYWTVNNGLSILQQWYITRKVERESGSKKRS